MANFLKTHDTECDNSAYNSPIFLLTSLASYMWPPTFKAVFKGGVYGLAGQPSTEFFNFNVRVLRRAVGLRQFKKNISLRSQIICTPTF